MNTIQTSCRCLSVSHGDNLHTTKGSSISLKNTQAIQRQSSHENGVIVNWSISYANDMQIKGAGTLFNRNVEGPVGLVVLFYRFPILTPPVASPSRFQPTASCNTIQEAPSDPLTPAPTPVVSVDWFRSDSKRRY